MIRQTRFLRAALCLAIALACGAPAGAAVVTAAYWRLGENDLGATPLDPCQPIARDFTGLFDLAVQGTRATNNAFYSSDVAASASGATGSILSTRFDNHIPLDPCYFFFPQDPCFGADNFGVEAWVKGSSAVPVNGTQAAIVYDGTFGQDGFGLYQIGDQYVGVFGASLHVLGSAPVTSDWVHLALVRFSNADGDGTSFYVNGVEVADDPNASLPATGGTAIGAHRDGADPFAGLIDEVRMFTFEPDEFEASDLLFFQTAPVVPEPESIALLGAGVWALLGFARRRRRLTATR